MILLRFPVPVGLLSMVVAHAMASELRPQSSGFEAPSQGTGVVLFTQLAADQTGLVVDNRYDDDQMWSTRYRAFMGGSMGSGVATGDFDGDGKADIYVSTKTKPGRLFRNLGGWKFADCTDAAGLSEKSSVFSWVSDAVSSGKDVAWRQGAVFVDVNNDGWPDLFVCRNNASNLLYINQGDSTFKEEAKQRGLGIIDGSVIGAFADYDKDGLLDVLILTNQLEGTETNGRRDRLFHNTGDGRFVEVTREAGITGDSFGHAAVWIDFDEDSWPDIYIANDFAGPDYLYRNNHDGTFSHCLDSAVPHTPYSSMGADTADVDNDGHPDLMVADMATTSRERNQRGLAASRGDVLMTGSKEGTVPQYMRNALFLNTGRGVFREAACWAGVEATDWTWSLRFEDFDNDGWQDLHVTNGMVREANNSDILFNMMGALSDLERIAVMKKSPVLAEANLAFRNQRGEGFEQTTAAWGLGEVGVSFGASTGDFDNDGDLDLVYLNYDGGLSVFRNDVVGAHRLQVRLRGTRSNRFGVGATVRIETATGLQSRTLTVARGYCSGSELVAHFGLGSETEIRRLTVDWPSGIRQTLEHPAADRAYTLMEPDTSEPDPTARILGLFAEVPDAIDSKARDMSILAAPDEEQTFLPFRTDRRGPGIAVADIDGDGNEEVYLSATTGTPSQVLRWRNDAYVAESPAGIMRNDVVEDGPPLFLDADGNGTPDLLVTRASAKATTWPISFQPILYTNDGHGSFSPTDQIPSMALNVGAACTADIDGDGKLDLFLGGRSIPGRYPDAPESALLRNQGGRFSDISERSPALRQVGLVKSALFRDVDRDGNPDLLLALEWDYVRYFHNDGDGRFSDWTEKSGFESGGRGWWNSLESADLNGDGRLDFVVGNHGLNTTYKASRSNPTMLLQGDFAQNGKNLVLEAVVENDRLFPSRAKADLGKHLPFLLRKFPKTDAFARADLSTLFGQKLLARTRTFSADNLSSGAFLSQPDGDYHFVALPRVAQISPIQGIVARDFDGDGVADLCAVQNSDIAVPRFDGGVGIFLKGKGDGTFEATSPERSGILVPGNGRALVTIDSTDHPGPSLLLTRHGGAPLLLAHQSSASTRWIRVRFRGLEGNPDALGAQVEFTFLNRPPLYHEVGAGGGWLSQSAAALSVAVPPEGRVIEAKVRWRDGRITRHPAPSQGTEWILQQPAKP